MINAHEIQGHWHQLAGKIKQHWGHLTEDDLRIVNGNVEQLVGRIQQRTGETREQVEKYINSLMEDAEPMLREAGQKVGEVRDKMREGYEHVADQARDAYSSATDLVARRPAQSLGAVLCAGMLLGAVVGLMCQADEGSSWR